MNIGQAVTLICVVNHFDITLIAIEYVIVALRFAKNNNNFFSIAY